jgi:hypothetical protein
MAVLTLLTVVLAACYSPDVRDCSVTCATADDCIDGQTCSTGLCATPGITCKLPVAPPVPTPPAPNTIAITVTIAGHGSVALDGVTMCDAGACTEMIDSGVSVALTASPMPHFVGWTGACQGPDPTCVLVPIDTLFVGALFDKGDEP